MKIFTNVIETVSTFLNNMAGVLFVCLMALVTINVILRSIFSAPILGAYDYASYGTSLAIALSLALCTHRNGHVAITFIADKLFPPKFIVILEAAVAVGSAVFFAYMSWHMYLFGAELAAKGVLSGTTRIPYYPFIYVVAGCFLIMALVLIHKAIALFIKEDAKR